MQLLLQDGRSQPSSEMIEMAFKREWPLAVEAVVMILLKDGRADPSFQNGAALKLAWDKKWWKAVDLLLLDERIQGGVRGTYAILRL